MKINNYPTYLKKDWKNNKGRFVNKHIGSNEFMLPIDDIDLNILKHFMKIKCVINKEYEKIHNFKYHNAILK
jgi:hypothetical protein